MQNDNILEKTLSCRVFLYAGNCAGSSWPYKQSGGHHGREDEFLEHVDIMVGKVFASA
jgi:hypothetical protein